MKLSKIFYFGIHSLAANIFKKYKKPLSVYWFLTYRCPFECRYCNVTNAPLDSQKELDFEKIKGIIKQMYDAGTRKIHLTGGEPLLHPDISKIIKEIKKYGMFLGISTSGYNIEKIKDNLKDVNLILLSLDGDKETHDKARGAGAFDVFEKAAEVLNEAGVKFWTTAVIHKQNKNSIDFLIDFAAKNNTIVNFQILHPRNENYKSSFKKEEDINEFYLTDEEFKQTLNYIIKIKKAGAPVGNSFSYLRFLEKWNDYKKYYSLNPRYKCFAGRLYCHIEPDGTVYPCGSPILNMKANNALESGFNTAFKKLQKPECTACLSGCHMEQNFIFSLNKKTIFGWLNRIKKL